jgi:membrane protein
VCPASAGGREAALATAADQTNRRPTGARSLGLVAALVAVSFLTERMLGSPDRGRPRVPVRSKPKPAAQAKAGSPGAEVKPATLFQIAKNVVLRIGKDNLTLVAAGVAFYAMLAIFPAIAAFVSLYGLFADPHSVEQQISGLTSLLPADSLKILTDALKSYADKSPSQLNVALVVSIVLALWSAKAGMISLMSGLNIANEQEEKRGYILQQVIALALTLGGIVLAALALGAIAVLPVVLKLLPIGHFAKVALELGRWPILFILVVLGFAVIYRFGPYKEHPKWRWITWGAAIAAVLWVLGSAVFSFYVSRFGSYDATYGSLAAAVVLLLWFWVSALVVLIGAEIDAELEHGDAQVARPEPGSELRLAGK